MEKLVLKHKTYDYLISISKYQFLLITDNGTYYRNPTLESFDSDLSCLVNNEKTGKPEILDYRDIRTIIIDGVHYEFIEEIKKESKWRKFLKCVGL